jgi:hypothetical protein
MDSVAHKTLALVQCAGKTARYSLPVERFAFGSYAPCGGSVAEFVLFPQACAWG